MGTREAGGILVEEKVEGVTKNRQVVKGTGSYKAAVCQAGKSSLSRSVCTCRKVKGVIAVA